MEHTWETSRARVRARAYVLTGTEMAVGTAGADMQPSDMADESGREMCATGHSRGA